MRLPEQPGGETVIKSVPGKLKFIIGSNANALAKLDPRVVDGGTNRERESPMDFPGDDGIQAGIKQPSLQPQGSKWRVFRPFNAQTKGRINPKAEGKMT